MSNGEKQNLISLVSTVLVSSSYLFYTFDKYNNSELSSDEELKFWATAILLIIPLRIVVQIVVTIFASIMNAMITGKELDDKADERDKLIELKGDRNSTNFFVFGFIASLLAVTFNGANLSDMFTILIISGTFSELIGIFSKIYYYRMGV